MYTKGFIGEFGGRFVPEILMYPLNELEESYEYYSNDRSFHEELGYYLYRYSGRPSPLYYASRLSERCQGRKVYLKREDLNHTGSHKINNTLG